MAVESNLRLMVAEENQTTQEIIRKILKDNGYLHVEFVENGEKAWEKLNEGNTDFALVDWKVAEPENFGLLDAIAVEHRFRSMPVLLMGAGAPIGKIEEAMKIGARDYINKPFTPYILMVKIEKALFGPYAIEALSKKEARAAAAKARGSAPVPEGVSERVSTRADKARSFYLKGQDLLERRKYGAAVAEFAKAIKFRMLFPEAYKGIADAFRGQGDLDRSGQFLKKAAETYAWLDRDKEATQTYEHVRKVDPGTPNPFKTVADHLRGQGNQKEVLKKYEQAARLSPKDMDVAVALSEAYTEAGQKEKAVETLRPIMEKHGADQKVKGLFMRLTGETGAPATREQTLQVLGDVQKTRSEERRRAQRFPFADYATQIPRQKEAFPVVDISMVGIGFKHSAVDFRTGETLHFDLITLGETKIKKVSATIKRVSPVMIGCEFGSLDANQVNRLKKIVPHA